MEHVQGWHMHFLIVTRWALFRDSGDWRNMETTQRGEGEVKATEGRGMEWVLRGSEGDARHLQILTSHPICRVAGAIELWLTVFPSGTASSMRRIQQRSCSARYGNSDQPKPCTRMLVCSLCLVCLVKHRWNYPQPFFLISIPFTQTSSYWALIFFLLNKLRYISLIGFIPISQIA